MPSKRTGYAPWSLTREAGVQSATVEGTIEVPQNVQPTLSTGFVDERGNWQGTKSSDEQFFAITRHVAVADGGETLSPATANRSFLDLTGYNSLFLAIRPSRGGNYKIEAVMGPDTHSFANLAPVASARPLRGAINDADTTGTFFPILVDSAEDTQSDLWNIFYIKDRLANQKLLQFKITNNSGGESTIDIAFMRIV